MTNYNLHRQILSQKDLKDFLNSPAFIKMESFLIALNDSVKGKERVAIGPVDDAENSPLIKWLLELLTTAEELIVKFPSQNRNADVNRFGNAAFRDWVFALQDELIPESMKRAPFDDGRNDDDEQRLNELEGYLVNSVGSSQRIDYGTGHELHFLVFLMGLQVPVEDYSNLVLKVFSSYIKLMRSLQKTYWLEPAGSHGVWGLDDYHFLPFLFGSGQLCGNGRIRPRAVHSAELVHYLAPKYIYFDSILNILQIKATVGLDDKNYDNSDDYNNQIGKGILSDVPNTNALRWMSPVLDDISAVKTWDKVNSGLIKMWKAEVMSKLPIMQHLLFGDIILTFKGNRTDDITQTIDDPDVTVHYSHSLRGDCCGNPLPSIYAATDKRSQPGLPFD
jgi:serine/threonine-protein phosphatase 2A activator